MKENIIICCPNCGMKHRIKFLDNERFDVEFKCPCGEVIKVKSEEQMSEWIKCDRCNKITKADSCGDKRYKIGIDGFDGYSVIHLCEWCLMTFYLDFLEWKWNADEMQYVPRESDRESEE